MPASAMAVSRCRRLASANIRLFRRARAPRHVAVVAPRRFRRDVTGDDVLLDVLAVALPRIAPPAAAGGAEGEPVAGLERDAGRLQELRRAAVAPRQDGFVDRARLAATQPPRRILGAIAIHVRNALLQCAVGEIDAES